ncbi:VWA domain-containing protein [Vandammella animalimorsus]|uniref:vWA domain-containing protein n=1 Tax=Vandammella animalimorsus TaxID=2029117 RepID=UPI00325B2202
MSRFRTHVHCHAKPRPQARGGLQLLRPRHGLPGLGLLALASLLAACSGSPGGHSASSPQRESAPQPPAPLAAPAPEYASAIDAATTTRSMAQPSVTLYATGMQPMPDVVRPRQERERYDEVKDNPVKRTAQESVSTLSLDVDTGAYANMRRFIQAGRLPPKDAVRVEELINYFPFDYPQASGAHPFSVTTELAAAPWNPQHQLLKIGVKAVEAQASAMPPANLVFLVDVSGSMNSADKLPLVQASLRLLVERLRPQDKVSLVVYAGRTAVELEPTSGKDKQKILAAIERLQAGGSTAGEAALRLAYQQARAGFIQGGINRILLATDGDFNVGISDVRQIRDMVERERKSGVSLTTLGFGTGNYNEALMQQIAQVGNGNYSYIDSLQEARKVLDEELSATFNTVAADVKLQLEFNPATVAEWRLIGYENRVLAEADFRNDAVDAVEIGAGKSVTALYEITPVGQPTLHVPRRYGQQNAAQPPAGDAAKRNELGELRIRYKKPGQASATELSQPIAAAASGQPSAEWQFAAAVAGYGQLLRGSPFLGQWGYGDAKRLAQQGLGKDPQGYRRSFIELIDLAASLSPKP